MKTSGQQIFGFGVNDALPAFLTSRAFEVYNYIDFI